MPCDVWRLSWRDAPVVAGEIGVRRTGLAGLVDQHAHYPGLRESCHPGRRRTLP